MAISRNGPLRLAVVGLGPLWEGRHRAALAELANRFRVTAVYDEVARRAAPEARGLGCAAPAGLAATIARSDVDAVYLLSPQWFGLHAATLALAAGKAVYSALPVASQPGELEALVRAAGSGGAPPYVPELARRFYPATLRLRELLATRLGAPRRIVGHARYFGFDRYADPGPTTQSAPLPMAIDPGGNLLDWCRFVMQAEPTAIQAFGSTALPPAGLPAGIAAPEDHGGFVLDFPGGATALVTYERYHREVWDGALDFLPLPGIQVLAEGGAAWLEMPDRIRWSDSSGPHDERLPQEPSLGEVLNDHFHRRVRGETSLSPTLSDALAASRLVQALLLSRREARRIALELDPAPLPP